MPMEETVGKGMALWMRARTGEVPQGPRNTAGVCRVIGFCGRGGLGIGRVRRWSDSGRRCGLDGGDGRRKPISNKDLDRR